jgi:hypothetical protein
MAAPASAAEFQADSAWPGRSAPKRAKAGWQIKFNRLD